MPDKPIEFPSCLYPAFAPLPVPTANRLLQTEEQKYRRRLRARPADTELMQTVLEKVRRARRVVYDYLNPFVLADRKRRELDESSTFPSGEWLLETLAQYTPRAARNSLETLDFWQKKRLLRRTQPRGLLEIASVAALLVARLSEENLQRRWQASSLEATEPWWWCYGRSSPDDRVQSIPVPISLSLPASLVLWTPWQGAAWDDQWQGRNAGECLSRWAGEPSIEELLIWDEEVPRKILACQGDPLFGRSSVQTALLREARSDVIARIVEKGLCPCLNPNTLSTRN